MDINSVMSVYNMNYLWSNSNQNSSSLKKVPIVNNLDSTIKEKNYNINSSDQTTSTELRDTYKKIETNYKIPQTYTQNGSLTIPSSTVTPTDGLNTTNFNKIPLSNSKDSSILNVQTQYNSVTEGTAKADISSVLSNNPAALYKAVDLIGASQAQNLGNYINMLI